MTVGDSGRHAMALRMGTAGIWWRATEVETQMERGEVERGVDLTERERKEGETVQKLETQRKRKSSPKI